MENLCEYERILELLDYYGYSHIIRNSDMTTIVKNDKVLELRWQYYDQVVVKPDQIEFIHEIYGSSVLITRDKLNKLKNILC